VMNVWMAPLDSPQRTRDAGRGVRIYEWAYYY